MRFAVFAVARQETPAGKIFFKDFTPLMISLKYITSLAFSQLYGAGGGYKKTPLYISLQANIIGKNPNKQTK